MSPQTLHCSYDSPLTITIPIHIDCHWFPQRESSLHWFYVFHYTLLLSSMCVITCVCLVLFDCSLPQYTYSIMCWFVLCMKCNMMNISTSWCHTSWSMIYIYCNLIIKFIKMERVVVISPCIQLSQTVFSVKVQHDCEQKTRDDVCEYILVPLNVLV